LYAIVAMFSSLAIALIIWYGGGQILQGALTFGTLVAFIQYIEKFFGPIRDLSAKYGVMQGAMAALERIFAVLDEPEERSAGEVPARSAGPSGQAEALVVFDEVSFAYRTGEPSLTAVNLTVRRGERVALVGESGGGKTTLVRLLGRQYEIDSGSILLDGTDIRTLPLAVLRQRMAVVHQEPVIFAGTVRFNISLGDATAEQRVQQAAAIVGADRFIERLPQRYETELSERGGNRGAAADLLCTGRGL
jgi:ATP-binding cassette subfamily B protein